MKSKKRRKGKKKKNHKSKQIKPSAQEINSTLKKNKVYELYQKYKKWIPVGLISTLFGFYISYYPEKIYAENELLGEKHPFSDAIILTNPNSYGLANVKIKAKLEADMTMGNITMKNNNLNRKYFFNKIKARKSTHINPSFMYTDGREITKISDSKITYVLSYETPFFYPDVKNDTILFIGVLNSQNEVIFLPK